MTELKSCPFCGGEARKCYHDIYMLDYVKCRNCGAQTGLCANEDEAVKAWNTRKEPITIMSPITTVSEGEPQTYVRERTCRNTHKNRWFSCSECGFGFMDMFACDEHDIEEQPRYCPNCGAKVVEE